MKRLALVGVLAVSVWSADAQTPGVVPTLFLPGEISTNLNERDMAISQDGSEMYYTLLSNQNAFSTILFRRKLSNGTWSEPEVAPFSGQYRDLEPSLSPDGTKLFFSSDRPAPGKEGNDYDIWMVERVDGKWSSPRNLGAPVNTKADEFYPSTTRNGNLYFTAAYDKGMGKEDIYVCRWINGSYAESVALDSAVNSSTWEFNAFVSPDESLIFFTSYGRKDDLGGGDLYLSVKDSDGKWSPAFNLKAINSPKLDYCPFLTSDGKLLFFTSQRHSIPSERESPVRYKDLVRTYTSPANGSDDIYQVSFEALMKETK